MRGEQKREGGIERGEGEIMLSSSISSLLERSVRPATSEDRISFLSVWREYDEVTEQVRCYQLHFLLSLPKNSFYTYQPDSWILRDMNSLA